MSGIGYAELTALCKGGHPGAAVNGERFWTGNGLQEIANQIV